MAQISHKGIAIAFNTVIIVLVAALVLSLVTVFFISGSSQSTTSIDHASAWARACQGVKAEGCNDDDFDKTVPGYRPDGGTEDATRLKACQNFFGDGDLEPSVCKTRCCAGVLEGA